MNEIIRRLKARTPAWFKKIRKIGLTCTALGTALLTIKTTVPTFELPAVISNFCIFLIISGTTATIVSQTATKDDVDK